MAARATGSDPSGRVDMAGARVGFYPSSRSVTTKNNQKSATKPPGKRITKPKGQN